MGKKILLADDNANIRSSLVNILEEVGYEVIQAASGQEAVEKARKENPDLVGCFFENDKQSVTFVADSARSSVGRAADS